MRSDTIRVTTSGEGVREAAAQVMAIAEVKGLSPKEQLRLKLLTEEMLGMLQGLTGEVEADFYIEEDDNDYTLHLATDTEMYAAKRRRLMEASTSNRNAAAVGITGKLRSLFESLLEPRDAQSAPVSSLSLLGALGNPTSQGTSMWSLSEYREQVKEGEDTAESWDELERSIIANIADDISVGIRGDLVEMTVSKRFGTGGQ